MNSADGLANLRGLAGGLFVGLAVGLVVVWVTLTMAFALAPPTSPESHQDEVGVQSGAGPGNQNVPGGRQAAPERPRFPNGGRTSAPGIPRTAPGAPRI